MLESGKLALDSVQPVPALRRAPPLKRILSHCNSANRSHEPETPRSIPFNFLSYASAAASHHSPVASSQARARDNPIAGVLVSPGAHPICSHWYTSIPSVTCTYVLPSKIFALGSIYACSFLHEQVAKAINPHKYCKISSLYLGLK